VQLHSQKYEGPNPMDSGLFLLLILSVSQKGLILCKVSGGERRYERTMDESNYARRMGSLWR
jgi:hypothetical protein